ncbi:MAG: acyl-CoA dehydrogenase family protein [Myxococcales bacterium]|nr:acyl-CoA dehydrogenase family protein [Myxococcales bacterium]
MIDLSEEDKLVRGAVRSWCTELLDPAVDELERGVALPYPLMRDFAETFALGELLTAKKRDAGGALGEGGGGGGEADRPRMSSKKARMLALVMLELSRSCPGFALAFGATVGLFGAAVLASGTPEQRERWALPVLRFEKVGAWALTEPGAGSDAFGAMATRAERLGSNFRIHGEKTFITNAPFADVFVVYAKDEGRVRAFLVSRNDAGVTTGPAMRKMGMHASPTGSLFLDGVVVPSDRLLGGEAAATSRSEAKSSLTAERFAMVPMALGIIERCLDESVRYAKERTQFGKAIAEFQLIQEKLARMHVAKTNLWALLLRQLEADASKTPLPPVDASAAKLYAARAATECALEAVQIMGGAGYMAGSVVEMMARDAKLLQIGGGTDEVQIGHIARALLA